MTDLLFELFSEEIPARMQSGAAEQLESKLVGALKGARLHFDVATNYVSPRHLAVIVTGLPDHQPDQTIERKGPKTSAPDQALEGFLKSVGLSKDQLEVRNTGKDDSYFAIIEEKGKPTADALKPLLDTILHDFHWPKSQRWGDYPQHWVRPLQNICCLFGHDIVPVEFGHLTANNITYGHRFLAPEAITIKQPADYVGALEKAKVIVDQDTRKEMIISGLKHAADEKELTLVKDDGLLHEVTGLVEWPVCLIGEFDEAFLDLPPEVLVSEMRYHQKYFALKKHNDISNHYAVVSNMITSDGGKAVLHGNGRVLRARLSDGAFYWDQDRKRVLSAWAEDLKGMIFHASLGSVKDKSDRIAALSPLLAVFVPHANLTKVERAAQLCKADLVSGMVGEFPDLQGVMGRYYAHAQEEDEEVADAIRDHYKPIGANDTTPTAPVSITVSLADKLDSLVGLFAINEKPTGSKDPFALRRAALGIIRTIIDNSLCMPLRVIIDKAAAQYPDKLFTVSKEQTVEDLLQFFAERLKVILKEQGIRHDLISAVFDNGAEDNLLRIVSKTQALSEFLNSDDGANLLAAYRRANNILTAEEKKDAVSYKNEPNEGLLEQDEEKQLYAALEKTKIPVKDALAAEKYSDAMQELASLRGPVDAYFDNVMVNTDASDLRINRLHTLSLIRARMDDIVLFANIEG